MKRYFTFTSLLIILSAFSLQAADADDWEAKGYTYTESVGLSLGLSILEVRLLSAGYGWRSIGLGSSVLAYTTGTGKTDAFALQSWLPVRLYVIPYANLEGGELNSLLYLYGGGSWWAGAVSDVKEEQRRAQYWDVGIGWSWPGKLIDNIRLGFLNAHIESRDALPEEDHRTVYLVLDFAGGEKTDEGKTVTEKDMGWRAKGIYRAAPSLSALLSFEDANEDGILHGGEEGKVKVIISNKGNESAREVSAQLRIIAEKLAEYLDIRGSLYLDELEPGKSETLEFTIKAKDDLPSDSLALSIVGGDREGHSIETHPLALRTRSYADYLMAAAGKPKFPPYPIASLAMEPESGFVQAESKLSLTLTVDNKGKGPLYQLLGEIKCESPFLSGKKFPIGVVEPGEKGESTLIVGVPPKARSREIRFEVLFSEYNDYTPDPISAIIYVEELPRPRFDYSYQLIDDNSGNSVGNGDGIFQKGEGMDLLLTVMNIGRGEARNVEARIDVPEMEGLVINVSYQKMGRLNPGELKSTRLTVTAKRTLVSNKVPLSLSIRDTFWNIEKSDEIEIPLGESTLARIMHIRRAVLAKEKELEIRGGAGNSTPVIAKIEEGGELLVTGQLGGWYRVQLPEGLKGWVPTTSVSLKREAVTKEGAEKLVQRSEPIVIRIFKEQPPSIAIFEPERRVLQVATPTIKVAGLVVDDKGVEKLEIKVNRKIIAVRSVKVLRKQETKLKFEESIPLSEGKNVITVVAYDTDGHSAREDITVVKIKKIPRIWAVIIGVSQYANVNQAKYADVDAIGFYDYLVNHLGVPTDHVECLINNRASERAMREALGIFLKEKAAKEDQVIIYFAGHGAVEDDPSSPDADGLSKYLLAHDTEADSLFSTGIPMDYLRRIFDRITSERIIFIGDTCYSGALGGRTVPTGERRATVSDKFLERLAGGKGRIILTACRANEISIANDDLGHGVFTYYLLQALKGKADYDNDGFITAGEAYVYVTEKVPTATEQRQHPVIKGEVTGGFVIGRS